MFCQIVILYNNFLYKEEFNNVLLELRTLGLRPLGMRLP